MPKSSVNDGALPDRVQRELRQLGERIRLARKRRKMTLADLSQRLFVDVKTLRRLENGEPGVGMGLLASAMFCLGLNGFGDLADPATDSHGLMLEQDRLSRLQRVRKDASTQDLDF